MQKNSHNHKIQLLKAVITVLENNSGIQKPGFGRDKEFGLVLANNKYKLPEKTQKDLTPETTLQLTEKVLNKPKESKDDINLTMQR